MAKYLGEYLLGKCLDEVWDAATGAPDVKELDLRLRAFENTLSQVDAKLLEEWPLPAEQPRWRRCPSSKRPDAPIG